MMRSNKSRDRGLAISTILLAIVLLAAIAVTIALSSRAGSASSAEQQDKLFATTILNQAQQIKTGFELAMSNGYDISTITYTHSAPVTNFLPAAAGIPSQVTPVQASVIPGWFYWLWHGAGLLVKIKNVGTGAGNYVIELDPIKQSVCQQINQALFGDPSIPTSTSVGWTDNSSAVDASTDPAVDGKEEGCFYGTDSSHYFYYKTVLVQ